MATFKTCVRNLSNDGYYNVYIRITHRRQTGYLRTDKRVKKSDVSRNGEIRDNRVVLSCARIIDNYMDRLNQLEIPLSSLGLQGVIEYLLLDSAGISFSDFARCFIDRLVSDGRANPADNYRSALRSFSNFMGRDNILFSDISSRVINAWIDSLRHTNRARNMYPTIIRTIFNAGLGYYNDYDTNLIRISHRPFERVVIPRAAVPQKRAVDAGVLRRFFSLESSLKRAVMARDVCLMIFCLAGINSVDLYGLRSSDLREGYLCYNRHKEAGQRVDRAYMEIRVPDEILPLFERYRGRDGNLFCFSEQYADFDAFNRNIRKGILGLTAGMDLGRITSYTFRHSWATIAQNDCGAPDWLVAFCLNHASAHKVTQSYIRKKFTPVDVLNRRVIDFVFHNGKG